MALVDDGDVVRAYGYVAIYFANLEEIVDANIKLSSSLFSEKDKNKLHKILNNYPLIQKIEMLQKYLISTSNLGGSLQEHDLNSMKDALEACIKAAHLRNDILHSAISVELPKNIVYRNSKRSGKVKVESEDVYCVANFIWSVRTHMLALAPIINQLCGRNRLHGMIGSS